MMYSELKKTDDKKGHKTYDPIGMHRLSPKCAIKTIFLVSSFCGSVLSSFS